MRLDERAGVREEKLRALKERIARLKIDLNLVEEGFTRGGGPGGQKVNKTSNRVVLRYPPLNLVIRCAKERKRSINRFLALRELVDRIEAVVSPATSPRQAKIDKLRRKKSRRRRKSRRKYQPA